MINRRQFTQLAIGAAAISMTPSALGKEATKLNKRGCCFTTKQGQNWQEKIKLLNPSWMYSWGPDRPSELDQSIEFMPMLWGPGKTEKRAVVLAKIRGSVVKGEVKQVLGFNEPDQKSQSNISVERAIEVWPELMELDVPLVSPGCVHPDRDWMIDFMKEVDRRDYRVDAIAIHSYSGPSAVHFLRRLEKVHKMFNRPLWITEFAVGDWQAKKPEKNRRHPEKIAEFMRDVLPALDELPYVQRYAWFSASQKNPNLGTSALIDESGNLTMLGDIYANHGTIDHRKYT